MTTSFSSMNAADDLAWLAVLAGTQQPDARDTEQRQAAEFPEYDPHKNILNRCTTDGNFVQTR